MITTYLQFLKREVRSRFVIAHVGVPRLGKLKELRFLSLLDVVQLLFLRCLDVVLLSLRLLAKQFIELRTRFASLAVVSLLFTLAAIFFEQAEEVEDFAVSSDADDSTSVDSFLVWVAEVLRLVVLGHTVFCHLVFDLL